jgi:hypothetical protein
VALAAITEADLWLQIREAAGRDFKGREDYGDSRFRSTTPKPTG